MLGVNIMTIKNQKFKIWQDDHKECEIRIEKYLADPSIGKLVEWLMETQTYPYAFLPKEWAGALNNIHNFVGLCSEIYHAFYDNGDINFVLIGSEPRILFESEHSILDRTVNTANVVFIEIKPNEFGKIRDEYDKSWIKKCFLNDAKKLGKAYMAEHYRKNHSRLWDESWLNEINE